MRFLLIPKSNENNLHLLVGIESMTADYTIRRLRLQLFIIILYISIAESGSNSVLGINLFTIWLWRLHNRVALGLASVNPCWNDERLFFTAREIVIAMTMQVHYYEMMSALMGEFFFVYKWAEEDFMIKYSGT